MTAPYSSSRFAYEGTETTETSIVRTGGAVDPAGQAQSRKIVTTANAQWLRPFRCEPYAIWNDTVGADVTVTVRGSYLGPTLDACDIWLEVEYLGDASSALGKIVTTTRSNVLAACSPLTLTSSAWADAQFVTFSPGNLSNAVLSNGALTITHTATGSSGGGNGLRYVTAGKHYFEVTLVSRVGSSAFVFGAVTSTGSFTDLNFFTSQFSVETTAGTITATGLVLANLGAISVGNIVCFAFDMDLRKGWARKGSGPWNNNATFNPATNVGGYDLYPTVGYTPAVYFSNSTGPGSSFTYNTGQTAFAHTPPAGFSGMMIGLSDFSLVATLNSPQPGRPGLIHVRPKIGKPLATVYLDPQIELTPASAAPSATHKSSRYAYEGTETTETSIVRSGGTAHSRKIVTTANSQWLRPYRAEPYAVWNETVGADVTVTVYGTTNSPHLILSDEIWLECEYLGDASSTLGAIVHTTKANVLATGAPGASDSSVWSGAVLSSTLTTLDGTPTASVAMSNGNLTATLTAGSTNVGVISNTFVSQGRYYFELTYGPRNGNSNGGGIIQIGRPVSDFIASNLNCVAISGFSGTIAANDTTPGAALGAMNNGDRADFAIDFYRRLIWIRRNGAAWNGITGADPVSGFGGHPMEAGVYAPFIAFGGGGQLAGNSATMNFGQSAYVGTPPAGYVNWVDTWTHFKLVATLNSSQPAHAALINVRVKAAKPSATFYIDPKVILS